MIKQIFKHICSSSDMVAHWKQLKLLLLGDMIVPREKPKLTREIMNFTQKTNLFEEQ